MKKFFTLLAVAAVAVSASALQFSAVSGINTGNLREAKAVALTHKSNDGFASLRTLPSLSDPTGTYYVMGTFNTENETTGKIEAEDVSASFQMVENTAQEEILLKNFLKGILGVETNDIKVQLGTIQEGGASAVVMRFANGQTLFSAQGREYKLCCGFSSSKGEIGYDLQSETFDFFWNTESGRWEPAYGFTNPDTETPYDGSGLAWIAMENGKPYGNVMAVSSFSMANGEFIGGYTEDGENFQDMTNDILGVPISTRGRIVGVTIHGILAYPLTLDCDTKTGILTGKNCVAGYLTDNSGKSLAVYYYNGNSAEMTVDAVANVVDGVTEISFGDALFIWDKTPMSQSPDGAGICAWAEPVIKFNADLGLGSAGIENVVVDAEDANAPVEYFNIQGQRVANPEAGQLVIRRQGAQVSKVIF